LDVACAKGSAVNVNWVPAAILPNISAKNSIEGDVVAFARCDDPRVLAFGARHSKFQDLLSRFTDAFAVPAEPIVQIVREDTLGKLDQVEPLASFRDLVALSVIPYARALGTVYGNRAIHRISYSNSFWLYPWMLARDNEHLSASTPAFGGWHNVDEFHGQTSPELPMLELGEIDEPLLQTLLGRWKRYYLGGRKSGQDRALFRSLNMATQAAQLPAGIDVTLYDLGRMISLWVSACEILAHRAAGRAGVREVYDLLHQISFVNHKMSRRVYNAFISRRNGTTRTERRNLPCWVYGQLYHARCDFLHGNPIRKDRLNFRGETGPYWVAPCVYRLVLTGFLKMAPMKPSLTFHTDPQDIIERTLRRTRRRTRP
jgi:hypothetical protein